MTRVRKRPSGPRFKDRPPSEPKPVRFVWQVVVLTTIGVVVRLVCVWQIRQSPFFDVLMGDARQYDRRPRRSRPATS